ncbi:AIR carboxylase family protein, partial [Limosilactobacillus fermentum]
MSKISVVMGSTSDWPTVKEGCAILDQFGWPTTSRSFPPTGIPQEMFDFAKQAAGKGTKVIIACAGGAAHLRGWWPPTPATRDRGAGA